MMLNTRDAIEDAIRVCEAASAVEYWEEAAWSDDPDDQAGADRRFAAKARTLLPVALRRLQLIHGVMNNPQFYSSKAAPLREEIDAILRGDRDVTEPERGQRDGAASGILSRLSIRTEEAMTEPKAERSEMWTRERVEAWFKPHNSHLRPSRSEWESALREIRWLQEEERPLNQDDIAWMNAQIVDSHRDGMEEAAKIAEKCVPPDPYPTAASQDELGAWFHGYRTALGIIPAKIREAAKGENL